MNSDYATEVSEWPNAKLTIELPAVVRFAAVLLTMFALLNVAREATYLIGSIQYYGAPQPHNYWGVLHSIISLVLGGMAAGLRRRSIKAWWTAVVGGGLFVCKLWKEMLYLMLQRSRGATDADVQIVLFLFAIGMLVGAILLLLTPASIETFWPKMIPSKSVNVYDAPPH